MRLFEKSAPEETIETERFWLRSVRPREFAARTLHWARDPGFLETFLAQRDKPWKLRQWRRHLRNNTRRARRAHGIWPKDGSGPVGIHMVDLGARAHTVYLSVGIGERDWWGKGVVREARAAILDHYFSRGYIRAWGMVRADNYASIYNYQRLGFRHEGTLRNSMLLADGSIRDELIFGMLAKEWDALKRAAAEQ